MEYRRHTKRLSEKPIDRRDFIEASLKTAGASALLSLPAMGMANDLFDFKKTAYTVQDIINLILKEIPGAPFKETVDTLKSGDASNQVTGIVTTMFATVKVIEEAARLNANFIIAHEPTFYNHLDNIEYVPHNEVVKQKQALLRKHQITIWRFHDYWHAYKPDGILFGVLKAAGWISYYQPGNTVLQIPSVSLEKLAGNLKSSLGISHLKLIGDLSQECSRVVLMPGAAGGEAQISIVEKEKPDVLIVGEVHEWETAEYIRDGKSLGSKTSLIILGHSLSEEPGMQWLVEWLQPKLAHLPVTHIPSGEPFTWL